jgi:hypothetical protein
LNEKRDFRCGSFLTEPASLFACSCPLCPKGNRCQGSATSAVFGRTQLQSRGRARGFFPIGTSPNRQRCSRAAVDWCDRRDGRHGSAPSIKVPQIASAATQFSLCQGAGFGTHRSHYCQSLALTAFAMRLRSVERIEAMSERRFHKPNALKHGAFSGLELLPWRTQTSTRSFVAACLKSTSQTGPCKRTVLTPF